MKIYAVLLIILLVVLQYKFWFEEGGYFHNLGLKEELAALRAENDQLKARNQQLAKEIILVKENLDEIESLARKNLGMIKEDEEFMFIIETEEPEQQAPAGQPDNMSAHE
mgnify:CR=1 FL=1